MSDNVKALLAGLVVGVLAYFLLGFWKREDQTIVRELQTRGELATEVWIERVRQHSYGGSDSNKVQYRFKIHYTTAGGQRYTKWAGRLNPQFSSWLGTGFSERNVYEAKEGMGGGFGVVYLPENPAEARVLYRKAIQGDYDWLPMWGVPLAAAIAAFAAYAGTLKLLTRGFQSN